VEGRAAKKKKGQPIGTTRHPSSLLKKMDKKAKQLVEKTTNVVSLN